MHPQRRSCDSHYFQEPALNDQASERYTGVKVRESSGRYGHRQKALVERYAGEFWPHDRFSRPQGSGAGPCPSVCDCGERQVATSGSGA